MIHTAQFENSEIHNLISSMQMGLIDNALFMATKLSAIMLKRYLIIFCCENLPNIHLIRQLLVTSTKTNELLPWIIRICKSTKTRIVTNTLRIACLHDEHPPEKFIVRYNDTTKQTIIIDEPFNFQIDKQDQIRLYNNARVIVNLLRNSDIYVVLNSFTTYIDKWVIDTLDRITHHRFLDVVLLFLSTISIKFAVNTEYLIPVEIPPINDIQTIIINENNNELHPSLNKTYLDTKGEELFSENDTPIEQLITLNINCLEIPTQHIISFIKSPLAFCYKKASHQQHHLTNIIFKEPFTQRIDVRDYLLADYLRAKLGLPSLSRAVCKFNNQYHIIENNPNTSTIDETKIEHETYYGTINAYKIEEIHLIIEDENLLLKLFKHLLFLQIIGVKNYSSTLFIHTNNEFYSLMDSIDYNHWSFVFKLPISPAYGNIYKSKLNKLFHKLKPTFKKWYKTIKTDQLLLPNMKIYLISELIRLMNFNEWRFSK